MCVEKHNTDFQHTGHASQSMCITAYNIYIAVQMHTVYLRNVQIQIMFESVYYKIGVSACL